MGPVSHTQPVHLVSALMSVHVCRVTRTCMLSLRYLALRTALRTDADQWCDHVCALPAAG